MKKSSFYPHQVADEIELITEDPIDWSHLVSMAHHPKAGAVIIFSGEVRNHNQGKNVLFLEYEAYVPLATKMAREILNEAREKWELYQAICVHRIGKVEISGCSVAVITSAAHRKEAYAANQFIIDKLKHEVPIWKREHYQDGTSEWGSNCNCGDPTHNHFHRRDQIQTQQQ